MPENVGKTVSCIFFDFLIGCMDDCCTFAVFDRSGIESMLCAGGGVLCMNAFRAAPTRKFLSFSGFLPSIQVGSKS